MTSLSPGGTVAIGVIVGLISTCVQSVGLTLQRKSHILEEEKEEHLPKRAPYRRRRWQIGMFLFLLSNIVGSTIQITTLPLPLLSTLQASGLVFNALLASLLLKEPFTRRTALGTVLVAIGAILISFFSALPEPSHTLDQLLSLLVVKEFLIWFTLTLFLVLSVTVATFLISRVLPPHRKRSPRTRLARGMSYGMISGILSAHALLLAKSAVELLVRTIVDKKNQFNRYQSWLLLLLFLFLALSQLYYLHLGLKLVSTSILYPFVFCIYNIIAILDGLIYFRQTDLLTPVQGALIAVGTAILLTGVLALSWRLSEDPPSDPSSPIQERIKADMPHSALTPGMGLVDEETNDVQTPLRSYFDEPYRDEPSDTEDSTGPFPTRYRDDPTSAPALSTKPLDGALDPAEQDANDERDPLLRRRPTTSSTRKRGSSDRRSAQALQRRRRSTIKEVQAVWDELRDERNWFPAPPSARSPRSPRIGNAARSPSGRYRDDPTAADATAAAEEGRPASGGAGTPADGRRKRVELATPTPSGAVRPRRESGARRREKRRTAPPGMYTFSGVLQSLTGASSRSQGGDASGEGRGVKRTVSWGQGGSNSASRDNVRDAGLGIAGAAAAEFVASEGGDVQGGESGRLDRDRVPSVGRSPSGASTEVSLEEDARRKSWASSVKLDWWRKKRRVDDGEGG